MTAEAGECLSFPDGLGRVIRDWRGTGRGRTGVDHDQGWPTVGHICQLRRAETATRMSATAVALDERSDCIERLKD